MKSYPPLFLIVFVAAAFSTELLIRNACSDRDRILKEIASRNSELKTALAALKMLRVSTEEDRAKIENYESRLHDLDAAEERKPESHESKNRGQGKWNNPFSDSLVHEPPLMPLSLDGKPVVPTAKLDKGSTPKPIVASQIRPKYPKELHDTVSGSVNVQLLIDTEGIVQQAFVKDSSNPLFENAALDAVKQWKFSPGKMGGGSVNVWQTIPIKFVSVNSDTHWF